MMAFRKKELPKLVKKLSPRGALRLAAQEIGYAPLSRKLKVAQTSLLAVMVGGLARESTETLVFERFAKLNKKRKAA